MKRFISKYPRNIFISLIFLIIVYPGYTKKLEKDSIEVPFFSQSSENALWMFSGLVKNKIGERFGYFFLMQRQGLSLNVRAALISEAQNELLFYYEKSQDVSNVSDWKWQVGQAFLNYNPINANWSFGVINYAGKGFSFKVDMLEHSQNNFAQKNLFNGLNVFVGQTSRLIGHIQFNKQLDQYVRADHSWFARREFIPENQDPHFIQSIFCSLNDFSGFYSLKLDEPNIKSAALASWQDERGDFQKISQFINIEQLEDDNYRIQINVPKLELSYKNVLNYQKQNNTISAGFFPQGKRGFCLFSNNMFA